MPSNFGRQENECHPILDFNKHHPFLEDKKHPILDVNKYHPNLNDKTNIQIWMLANIIQIWMTRKTSNFGC